MSQPSQLYIIQNATCLAKDIRNFTSIIPSYANLATMFPWTIPTLPRRSENFTKNLVLGHQEAPYHEQALPLDFWNFSYDFRPYYFRNRICWLIWNANFALFVVIRLLASFFSTLDTKSSPPNYSEDMSKSRKQLWSHDNSAKKNYIWSRMSLFWIDVQACFWFVAMSVEINK